MAIVALPYNERAARINRWVEGGMNAVLRSIDRVRGRAANYDDERYEFVGGPSDELRKKHYDKSLRLLWKAQTAAPWSTFRDASGRGASAENAEREVDVEATRGMSPVEVEARQHITSDDFRRLLRESYTPAQRRAMVKILSAIGHGEAYAWLVSASLMPEVQSTGARAALTMQVLEEAKHFVVMRELVEAFGEPVPRQSAWEYLLLEKTLRARGYDRFFGMNVLVETIALTIFGMLEPLPGMDVLRLFHLDESRHTALPVNYFKEYPMPDSLRESGAGRVRRLLMALPALPLVLYLEPELAELGIDAFDFAGSILRKVGILSVRAGFIDQVRADAQSVFFNDVFNRYCALTRPGHRHKDFMAAETTTGQVTGKVEREIFAA
jgi:hypothetical protein